MNMPPLRSNGRASKACERCRNHKTRCYASDNASGGCLRCQTLAYPCSLESAPTSTIRTNGQLQRDVHRESPSRENSRKVDERLHRLESTVQALVDRLDSRLEVASDSLNRRTLSLATYETPDTLEQNEAPVFLIRDAAIDAGVQSPELQPHNQANQPSDVISTQLIDISLANSLLSLFHIHYGRWVKFHDNVSTETLLSQVRKSPLLLCSIFLIAIRHTTEELADELAPKLFDEAKKLITASLLVVPQAFEFFQAVLILSLWSTSIGQVPLSIDSWTLTGFALQQVLVCPSFAEIIRPELNVSYTRAQLDAWCVWNHITLAHLQYCVGTNRRTLLNQSHIDRCLQLVEYDDVNNYEARMISEVKLYWIIYKHCCGPGIDLNEMKHTLQGWQREYAALFNQPRSQFLQMGFHFGHLLGYCQFLKSPRATMTGSVLKEMARLSTTIINLAMDTTDDRTRHLTDHIYHVIVFSALTLCRLVNTYEMKLRAVHQDIEALDDLIFNLVGWLKSVGPPCHAAHMLGGIVSIQLRKLRPASTIERATNNFDEATKNTNEPLQNQSLPTDISDSYPNIIWSELFDIDTLQWPEWGQMYSETEFSG